MGQHGQTALDANKLATLKKVIESLLPGVSSRSEMEKVWCKCVESIRDLAKRLRYQLKQYNLLVVAAHNEGLPVPPD